MQTWFVGTYIRLVLGENAAGCWSLVPRAAGQMPVEFSSSPFCSVEYWATTCGRPYWSEFGSITTSVAQFTTGSNFSATSSSPVSRSIV